MTNRAYVSLAAVLTLAAGTAAAAPRPPDYARIAGEPASPHGKAYADGVGQAVTASAYDQTSQKNAHLLRFHCSGAPAKALYDALGPWSAAQHSEWSAAGRTWRATEKIEHDLFGTDYCSSDGAGDYACDVTLNVGAFLAG